MDVGQVRVLLVEDNPGDARLVHWLLSRPDCGRFRLTAVERLADAFARLREASFDVVLLDLSLPDSSGLDTVRQMRRAAATTPVVIMTGLDDERAGLESLREGAQDYLVKGTFDSRLLEHALLYAVERGRATAAAEQRRRADRLLAAISQRLLNTTAEKYDAAATEVLRAAGTFAGADRCGLYRLDHGQGAFSNTHEWCAEGVTPRIAMRQAEPQAGFRWLLDCLRRGEPVRAARAGDLPEAARAERKLMEAEGIRSVLVVPLVFENALQGFLGLSTLRAEREWTEFDAALLCRVADLLAATLQRRHAALELAEKNAALAALNETKNQFLGMAAHDLRNPVTVIYACSSFLLEDTEGLLPTEKRVDFLRRIRANGEFMARLLEDLLDLARIESGEVEIRSRPLDIASLLGRNVEQHAMLAERKGISLVLARNGPVPDVLADPGRIEQVLNNLVTNAVKFSNTGTTVTVRAARQDGSVVVSVEDQGPGIPADEMQRLFKPFQKTSVRSTAGERSTGLGLAICRRIVEVHRGRIWVESEPGRGSVFSFSLPVAAD